MMVAGAPLRHAIKPGRGRAKAETSILDLLEWAFQRELVSLDLNGSSDASLGYGYASATSAIIQHEQLGCRIDGGGSSPAHPDADRVAEALAALPEAMGGQRMAIWMAEMARAGQQPDWRPDPKPTCRPVEWRQSKHGCYARTERAGQLSYAFRGRLRVFEIRYCPVTYTDSAEDIGRARRQWLRWWSALHELRITFQICSRLTSFEVNDELPPIRPWEGLKTKSLDV